VNPLAKAFPGGVDGRTHRSFNGGTSLIVEPTNPGAQTVHMWVTDAGGEVAAVSFRLEDYRRFIAVGVARLAVMDPDGFPFTSAITDGPTVTVTVDGARVAPAMFVDPQQS
jgi:hypothetical protein